MEHPHDLSPAVLSAAETLWNFHSVDHTAKPCDVMLVLGSHDLRVPDHAARLYHAGLAPWVVCSGGIAHTDDLLATGWNQSEADVFAARLIAHAVPAAVIRREQNATNTGQNFSLTKALLATEGITCRTLLVVTKPYMERRALATADVQMPDVTVCVTAPRTAMRDYLAGSPKGIATEIAIMVGDLQRFKTYPAKGFMSEQAISPAVWAAFDFLVEQGFTGNLQA